MEAAHLNPAVACSPIPSVFSLPADGFPEHFGKPGLPVLIKGCMGNWPALQRWTPEFFERQYGHIQVTVRRCQQEADTKQISLAEYIQSLHQPSEADPYYLRDWEFEVDCPSLLSDYRRPACFESWHERLPAQLRPRWRWIFIGHAGTSSRMHVDVAGTSAWNALTYGAKRWLFWPPEQEPLLYGGAVDGFYPDLNRFPRFAQARGVECVQEPGDIIFTPARWWHQVRNETVSIAVTENFVNQTNVDMVASTLRNLLRVFPGDTARSSGRLS